MGPQDHVDIIYRTHWFCASEKDICQKGAASRRLPDSDETSGYRYRQYDHQGWAGHAGNNYQSNPANGGVEQNRLIAAGMENTAIIGAVNDKAKETVNII